MKAKHLYVFAAVLLLLVVIYLLQKSAKGPNETSLDEKFQNVVPGLVAADVEVIKAWPGERKNGAVTAKRTSDGWIVESHFDSLAGDKPGELLDNLKTARAEIRSKKVSDHASCGVDQKGALHVVLLDAGGREITHLLAGKETGDGGSFVRRAGQDTVYYSANLEARRFFEVAVKGDLPAELPQKPWLDLDTLDADASKITKVTMRGPYRDLEFEYATEDVSVKDKLEEMGKKDKKDNKPEKKWKCLTAEFADYFKPDEFKRWLAGAVKVTADNVANPANAADYGLEPPRFEAVFAVENGAEIIVSLGKKMDDAEGRYMKVTGRNEVFVAPKCEYEKIAFKTREYMDLTLIAEPENEIQSIAVKYPRKTFEFTRKKGEKDWVSSGDEEWLEFKKRGVERLARRMKKVEAFDVIRNPETLADEECVYSLTISNYKGAETTLRVGELIPGREERGERFIKVSGKDGCFSMDKETFDMFFRSTRDYYDIKAAEFEKDNAKGLTLTISGVSHALKKEDAHWYGEYRGLRFLGDAGAIDRFLGEISSWRPEDFLDEKAASGISFDCTSVTSVEVGLGDKDFVRVTAGPKVEGEEEMRYFLVEPLGRVFVGREEFFRRMGESFRKYLDMRAVSVLTPEIKAVRVAFEGGERTFYQREEKEGVLYWTTGERKPVRSVEKKIQEFVNRLKEMRIVMVLDEAGEPSSKAGEALEVKTEEGTFQIRFGELDDKNKSLQKAWIGEKAVPAQVKARDVKRLFDAARAVPEEKKAEPEMPGEGKKNGENPPEKKEEPAGAPEDGKPGTSDDGLKQ